VAIKTEADANDIIECPCSDMPSTGMFAVLVLCSLRSFMPVILHIVNCVCVMYALLFTASTG